MVEIGQTVLVAVSGGVDSVVLLAVLRDLAPGLSLKLVLAHLDHGLRGKAARDDAQFVATLGQALQIPVIHQQVDVRTVRATRRMSLEEAGRFVRREFLSKTRAEVQADRIALGHTLDDRVETLLFNLIRGAGGTGLVGIRPVDLPYIRPLIDTSRQEVLAFARSRGLVWREDETNRDLGFSRNRIRHQVIPLLTKMNPRLLKTLQRTADLSLEESEALNYLLESSWQELLIANGEGEIVLDRRRLADLPRGLQRLLLRRGIARARGDLQGVEKNHVDALCHLVTSSHLHGEAHLPGLRARVENETLRLFTQSYPPPASYTYPLKLGRTELPELGIALQLHIEDQETTTTFSTEGSQEVADADRVHLPLYVRNRQHGDRFQPLGMATEKKLKAFLMDEHVPFYKRDQLPLLCDQERIIWVIGQRLSHAVRVTPTTKRLLVMRMDEQSC
jgi:tRNA(Ile)-lysidine synthase